MLFICSGAFNGGIIPLLPQGNLTNGLVRAIIARN